MENLTLAEPGATISVWALFWQAGWVVKLVMIGLLGRPSGPGRSSSTS